MRFTLRAGLGLVVVAALIAVAAPAHRAYAGGDWNDGQVAWKSYDDGLALAKKEQKPICLIFFTEWCPHCKNYSGVFHDPKVVEQSKQFVMIRLDKDKNPEISKKYAPDGEYIPRTYFLKPDGTLDQEIHAPRDQYKYFYDETQPGSVLSGMDTALKKMKPKT
jgi:thiol:disulfide interchange protein